MSVFINYNYNFSSVGTIVYGTQKANITCNDLSWDFLLAYDGLKRPNTPILMALYDHSAYPDIRAPHRV